MCSMTTWTLALGRYEEAVQAKDTKGKGLMELDRRVISWGLLVVEAHTTHARQYHSMATACCMRATGGSRRSWGWPWCLVHHHTCSMQSL